MQLSTVIPAESRASFLWEMHQEIWNFRAAPKMNIVSGMCTHICVMIGLCIEKSDMMRSLRHHSWAKSQVHGICCVEEIGILEETSIRQWSSLKGWYRHYWAIRPTWGLFKGNNVKTQEWDTAYMDFPGWIHCLELNRTCVFQTHDNKEHLAMMERILGSLPYRMAKKTKWAHS